VIQLDEKTAAALSNLRASADFRALMEWLKQDLESERTRCVQLDGVALHRAQGAATKLIELQRAYDEAPETAKKLFSKRSQG
jgi:hypothetical protein